MTVSTSRTRPVATLFLLAVAWLSGDILALAQRIDSAVKPLPARNVVTLREKVGQTVTVNGRVASTGESKSGIQFLNFESSELTAVCYPEHVPRFPRGKPSVAYRNQQVELTGQVKLYRNKLQIELSDPAQIRIVDSAAAPPKGIELRKTGPDSWLSPAGLHYRGRDPSGLTRVEHIERHAQDEPDREGPHGVFDGGSSSAFAIIDAAWELAQKKRLRPEREGDRSSYSVPMGRRVGYLGGKLGAAKRHPPLFTVFLVLEADTRNVITAFPK